MGRIIGRASSVVLVIGLSAATAAAQDARAAPPVTPQLRFSLAGEAGLQTHYRGTMQSIAFGFAPTRSLTVLVSAQRSYVDDRFERYVDGYSSERGGTEHFLSAEVRYAFLPSRRVSPYVMGGSGRGISRPNVNANFPDRRQRDIQVLFYGGGVRIPVRPRLDAFVDARIIMYVEARSDYFAVRLPVRAGVAWRF